MFLGEREYVLIDGELTSFYASSRKRWPLSGLSGCQLWQSAGAVCLLCWRPYEMWCQ